MQEGLVMDMFKLLITASILIILITVFQLFLSIGKINDYKQYVNMQIERNGGLTEQVENRVEKYNQENCNGAYTVIPQDSQKHPYGTEIDYQVQGAIKIMSFSLPDFTFKVRGSAVSLVRGG